MTATSVVTGDRSSVSAIAGVLAVVLGVLGGLSAQQLLGAQAELVLSIVEPVGVVWLAALQMLVLPLTVAVLTVAIGRAGGSGTTRIGSASLAWFVGMLAGAAVLTVVISPSLLTLIPTGGLPGDTAQLLDSAGTAAGAAPSFGDWLRHLVPTNLARAAADGDLFAVMVATLLFGAALRLVPTTQREPLLTLAESVSAWCLALASLLLRVLPIAVFALTFTGTMRAGTASVSALARYIVVLSGLLVLATLLLYPFTTWFARIPFRRFATAVWPAQLLAFSSRSSAACLPIMLETARGPLGLAPRASDVTLPLAVATFKLNMGISANFQLFFLLHVYGIHPPPGSVALAVVALTLQSFATPGLPSGAVWTTTPVYLALGIPMEGIVLTNVVDTIPDLFKTVANVTGDLSLATIVARRRPPPEAEFSPLGA